MSCALSIIVVSYNTRDLTLACLRSVYEQTKHTSFEILVVDNASSDGSAQTIADDHPDVILIERSDNLGFADANNLAARRALGQWILLLNPDTVVLDGAIDTLVEFAKRHLEHGVYGGRTLFPDSSLNPTSCWGRPTPWSSLCRGVGLSAIFRHSRLFDPESIGRWQRDAVREVDIVTGCFLLIRRELWEQLGGFDSDYFMYGEEADLCLRAARLGARPIVCPEATIIHYGGASETVRADKVVRLLRAKRLLERRHWPSRWWAFGDLMRMMWVWRRRAFWAAAQLTGRSLAKDKAGAFDEVWRRRSEWLGGIAESPSTSVSTPTASSERSS